MTGEYLVGSFNHHVELNIYSKKSAMILNWLLLHGKDAESISLRKVAESTHVSLGLVHKVFKQLVLTGILETKGVRTSKTFILRKPLKLLMDWVASYNVLKKCKMRTYSSSFSGRKKQLEKLAKHADCSLIAPALHTSAEALGYCATNLDTLELYVRHSSIIPKIENILELEPQERGYDVLLLTPYYSSLLDPLPSLNAFCKVTPLLTFLDLYHFPLRGQEQAVHIVERAPELSSIWKGKK